MEKSLVYLHGVGGSNRQEDWLLPLNRGLSHLGYSPLTPDYDLFVEPAYQNALWAEGQTATEVTWKRPTDARDWDRQRLDYFQNRERFASAAKRHGVQPSGPHFGHLPDWTVTSGGRVLATLMKDAKRYRGDRGARERVWKHVLDVIPQGGPMIVVAHSLGSVVAVDLLRRLGHGTRVDLLLTLGSPLGAGGIWTHMGNAANDFPFDRVGAWVNIFDPRDVITGGRGVIEKFPMALDLAVHLRGTHDLPGYCSHPQTATVLGEALYGQVLRVSSKKSTVARRMSRDWDPILLSFAYGAQVSRTCKTHAWQWKSRFDHAREIRAWRMVADLQVAESLNPDVGALKQQPSSTDLLSHATDLVRDSWSDDELLPLLVSLFMSPVVPPFDIKVDETHRTAALSALLDRIRKREGEITDDEMSFKVAKAVREARKLTSKNGTAAWMPLLGLGVALLAVTGIGVVAAVPAGLAGAAAITATLAAFGPGGMVGGMLTLAAITGASTAFIGAGATGVATQSGEAERFSEFSIALAQLDLTGLRSTLTAIVAVVMAQDALELTSTKERVTQIIRSLHLEVGNEAVIQQQVAPGRPGTREWEEKTNLVSKVVGWLSGPEASAFDLKKQIEG